MQLQRLPYKLKRGLKVYADLYLRQQTPVLIYTTGRVGSMALHHALQKNNSLVIQLHTLDPAKLLDNQQPGTAVWAYHHIIKPQRPAHIINIVRDPLALMVSDFFPKLRWITGQENAFHNLSVDELCQIFITRYFEQERHLEKLNWFENEMERWLGIDVYTHPFPRESGYLRFEAEPYQVLLIKTETNDDLKSRVVGDFVGQQSLKIERRNTGESKSYGDVYAAFKQQLNVPQAVLDVVYQSRLAQHFYDDDERNQMRQRWSK